MASSVRPVTSHKERVISSLTQIAKFDYQHSISYMSLREAGEIRGVKGLNYGETVRSRTALRAPAPRLRDQKVVRDKADRSLDRRAARLHLPCAEADDQRGSRPQPGSQPASA